MSPFDDGVGSASELEAALKAEVERHEANAAQEAVFMPLSLMLSAWVERNPTASLSLREAVRSNFKMALGAIDAAGLMLVDKPA